MHHDFRDQPEGEAAERFLNWLEHETIDMFWRTAGDAEGTKTAIFLYVNRACEAHLPEQEMARLFGRCFVRAGRPEEEQDAAFDQLEFFAEVAKNVHAEN
jgi:hypothetical protein